MGVILSKQHGDVAVLHFDDGKANAVGLETLAAFDAALDEAEGTAKAIVLIGRPGRFCAGFDLRELRGDTLRPLLSGGARLLARLLGHPQPVTIACTGHALGLGGLLLLAGDHRIACAGDYKVSLNEVAIGLAMPEFGVALVEERLSKRHTTRALALAEVYSPAGAVDAGFLDRMCPQETLLEEAIADGARFAATLDGEAHTGTKRRLRGPTIERILSSVGG